MHDQHSFALRGCAPRLRHDYGIERTAEQDHRPGTTALHHFLDAPGEGRPYHCGIRTRQGLAPTTYRAQRCTSDAPEPTIGLHADGTVAPGHRPIYSGTTAAIADGRRRAWRQGAIAFETGGGGTCADAPMVVVHGHTGGGTIVHE